MVDSGRGRIGAEVSRFKVGSTTVGSLIKASGVGFMWGPPVNVRQCSMTESEVPGWKDTIFPIMVWKIKFRSSEA